MGQSIHSLINAVTSCFTFPLLHSCQYLFRRAKHDILIIISTRYYFLLLKFYDAKSHNYNILKKKKKNFPPPKRKGINLS